MAGADREPAEIMTIDADPIDVAVAAEEHDGLAVRVNWGPNESGWSGVSTTGVSSASPIRCRRYPAAGPEQTTASPAGLSAAM